MKWRLTLGLLVLAGLVLILVWFNEGREGGESAQERLARGLLYPYDADALEAFEVIYPERSFRLERRGEEWWMAAPVVDLGDAERIVQMLATLESQAVERWLPPATPAEREEFGLAAPRLRLRLERRSGADTLSFGHLNEVAKRVWMATSYRDSVALVSTLLRTHFLKGYFQLLDKHPLAPAPREDVESIHIDNDYGYFALVPRGSDGGWEIQRRESYPADAATVQRMLEQVFSSTIVQFIQQERDEPRAYGFGRPAGKLTIKLRQGPPRMLEIGDRIFRLRYARNLDRPQIFMVDSLTFWPILESYSAFLSVVLLEFLPGEIVRVEGPDGALLIRDEDSSWSWRDERGIAVSGDAVASLLNRMMRLYTERVEALLPREDQLRQWGLDPPRARYRLVRKSGGELVLELGGEIGERRALRRADYPSVYSLPPENLDFAWPGPAEE
jgi:hypothetical protein